MNDSERAALVEVIEAELDSYCPSPFNGAFAVSLMQIIDRLLTTRPEPAADMVRIDRLGSILRMEYARGYQDAKKEMQVRTFSSTTINNTALQAAAKGTEGKITR